MAAESGLWIVHPLEYEFDFNGGDELEQEKTVQDYMQEELLEDDVQHSANEMLEIMEFMKRTAVPLTEEQVKASFLLHENDLSDIAFYMERQRPKLTPTSIIFKLIDKFTMADRIKGTAKLKDLMKASASNPSQQVPNANDYKMEKLSEKELAR